ncbi:MAG: hypothetical protein U0587_15540 [Candidatus Binatia bacterium]
MPYRLDELAKLSTELGLVSRRVDADRLDVVVEEGCVLAFCNLKEEADSLVGFEGTPWHSHGLVQFLTGEATYVEYDELDILLALSIGDLVIVSEYSGGQLLERSLVHRQERLDLRYLKPGDETRVFRLRDRNTSQG